MSTLRDVAKKAGVSVAAVSFYLNNTKKLKEETRQAIAAALEECGYRYNATAASLKRNQSSTLTRLGLISIAFHNPFFSEQFFKIENKARERNISVISSFLGADLKGDFEKSVKLMRSQIDLLLIVAIEAKDFIERQERRPGCRCCSSH